MSVNEEILRKAYNSEITTDVRLYVSELYLELFNNEIANTQCVNCIRDAAIENGVMNVPNYGNVATSGTYVPALTNYSNIASSSAFEAMYMHIGNMYSLSIKTVITPSAAGSCILRITLPQQSNNKAGVFSVTSISNDQSTVLPSFTYTAGGADYVGVTVNVPSTASVTLTVTGMYTH